MIWAKGKSEIISEDEHKWTTNEHWQWCHLAPWRVTLVIVYLVFFRNNPREHIWYLMHMTVTVAAKYSIATYSAQVSVKLLTLFYMQWRWDVPIHVDAASGGFIAPFLYPELEWDFRLPLVKSINVSGHKYGLVYAGVGWVIWRSKEDLPEELIFHINYLGTDQPTFTLNFSKGIAFITGSFNSFGRSQNISGNYSLGTSLQVQVRSLHNTISSFA